MKHTLTISCLLCDSTLCKTSATNVNIDIIAYENKLLWLKYQILENNEVKEGRGYVCSDCARFFSSSDSLKKIIKNTVEVGNSSAVILPRSWLEKNVVTFLIEK